MMAEPRRKTVLGDSSLHEKAQHPTLVQDQDQDQDRLDVR